MSKNIKFNHQLYSNERPPLPPKVVYKSTLPLPPKLKESKEVKKESKMKYPSKTVILNNSCTLSNFENHIFIKNEKQLIGKVDDNHESKSVNKKEIKKDSIITKFKMIMKKSVKSSQSKTDDKISVLTDNHEVNEPLEEEQSKAKYSNITICGHSIPCCQICHFHHYYHHHHHHHHHHCHYHQVRCPNMVLEQGNHQFQSLNLSCFHHDQLDFSNTCGRFYESSFNSSFNNISPDFSLDSQLYPVIPNRNRLDSSETKPTQYHFDECESKTIAPPIPLQKEKYSNNFLNKNLMDLKKVGWYWGSVSSSEAEKVMANRPDGTFLVRDSGHSEHLFSVTFRVNCLTYHARIQFLQNRFWWNHNNQDNGFGSIIEMIENSLEISRKGECRFFENTENASVPLYAVSLLNPLSRFSIMSSLKHLARFVIITNVRNDHLDLLPLPHHLLSYLHDKEHHYIENIDRLVSTFGNTDIKSVE